VTEYFKHVTMCHQVNETIPHIISLDKLPVYMASINKHNGNHNENGNNHSHMYEQHTMYVQP
jgi:hypothetical protein